MVYYVALPFIPLEGGLAPGEAVECPNGAAAIRIAATGEGDGARVHFIKRHRLGAP
jgi:hypothetical protein